MHDPATLVTLGGCPLSDRAYSYSLKPSAVTFDNICKVATNPDGTTDWVGQNNLGPRSPTYSCTSKQEHLRTYVAGLPQCGTRYKSERMGFQACGMCAAYRSAGLCEGVNTWLGYVSRVQPTSSAAPPHGLVSARVLSWCL